MFKTEICGIFGIRYPIVLGGMVWAGGSALAAAVSEAGGLGLLGAGGMSVKDVEEETAKIMEATSKPFGMNVPLVRPDAGDLIDAALKGGAAAISTSSGSPKLFTRSIKDRGAKVLHVVSSLKFAKKCEEAGVDVIAAEGVEAGGHNGRDEITTMVLTPQVAGAVGTPVIAAGGIADGRGFVAALALGAKGVQMGTRFLATHESAAHRNVKEAIVGMKDTDSTITGRTAGSPTRCIRNKLTDTIIAEENKGTPPEKLYEMIGEGRWVAACVEGDVEEGSVYCGQVGGAVKELKSAKQVIDDIIAEAEEVVKSIQALANS